MYQPIFHVDWAYAVISIFLPLGMFVMYKLSKWVFRSFTQEPIVIKNLDLESFLTGCKLAIDNPNESLSVRLNPHEVLGFKLTILMSSPNFLESSPSVDNYVSVTIGEDKDNPHVIFNYKNRLLQTRLIESIIKRSCCLVTISAIKDKVIGIEEIPLLSN